MEAPNCEPLISKTRLRKLIAIGWCKASDAKDDGRFILLRHGQTEAILITRAAKFDISNGDIVEIHEFPAS